MARISRWGLFQRPLADAAARRFFEIFEKNAFFEKLVKIGFLTLFGSIWIPNSDSAWKTGPIHGLKPLFHHFLQSDFQKNPIFGYFFKLRSILMLPGLKIPLKSEKITKNRIYKKPGFQKMVKYWFELMSLYQFFTLNSIPEPKSTQNQPKTWFWPNFQKIRFL